MARIVHIFDGLNNHIESIKRSDAVREYKKGYPDYAFVETEEGVQYPLPWTYENSEEVARKSGVTFGSCDEL